MTTAGASTPDRSNVQRIVAMAERYEPIGAHGVALKAEIASARCALKPPLCLYVQRERVVVATVAPVPAPEPVFDDPGLEAHRATIIEALKSAVRHKMDLGTYESALRRVMEARSSSELADVGRSLPVLELAVRGSTVGEALIRTGIGIQRRRGRWPVAARTTVETGLGSCWLDFSDAVFDDRLTDLHVTTGIGFVRLAIPPWIAIEFASVVGGVSCAFGHEAAPVGLPIIRLHANAKGGTIRLRRPRSLR